MSTASTQFARAVPGGGESLPLPQHHDKSKLSLGTWSSHNVSDRTCVPCKDQVKVEDPWLFKIHGPDKLQVQSHDHFMPTLLVIFIVFLAIFIVT